MESPRHRGLIVTGLTLVLSAAGLWVFALPAQWRPPPEEAFRSEVVQIETGREMNAWGVSREDAVVIWTEGLRPVEGEAR